MTFNRTTREPYELNSCSHTLCLACLIQNIDTNNKCSQCGKLINGEYSSCLHDYNIDDLEFLVN